MEGVAGVQGHEHVLGVTRRTQKAAIACEARGDTVLDLFGVFH
jgi:hypothetical protein